MADDLVQRLRAWQAGDRDAHHEAADALARKDAEIAELQAGQRNILSSVCDAVEEVDRLRKMNEGLRQQHATDSVTLRNLCDERDEQRQRAERAEARVREAPVATVGGGKLYGCYVEADVPTEWRGKRVALVLLDTEEAK